MNNSERTNGSVDIFLHLGNSEIPTWIGVALEELHFPAPSRKRLRPLNRRASLSAAEISEINLTKHEYTEVDVPSQEGNVPSAEELPHDLDDCSERSIATSEVLPDLGNLEIPTSIGNALDKFQFPDMDVLDPESPHDSAELVGPELPRSPNKSQRNQMPRHVHRRKG